MDWTQIISMIISGGVIGGVVEVCASIRYRKQNAKIKDSEATQSNVEAQKAKLELGDLYLEKVLQMSQTQEEMRADSKKNLINQEEMMGKLDRLDTRTENVEISLADVVKYLNGDYQNWLAKKKETPTRYGNPA